MLCRPTNVAAASCHALLPVSSHCGEGASAIERPPFYERSPIRAPVAQTSVRKKRKVYATSAAYRRTLTGRKLSVKITQRAPIQMIKKFAFEYKIGSRCVEMRQ